LAGIDGTERVLVERVRGHDDLGRAVSDISRVLRQISSGYRATSGQAAHQDDKVSTPSLAAFRLYSASLRTAGEARWDAAFELATQAIQEDPGFASAHAWQAWCSMVLNRPELAKTAIGRAVELVNTTSEPERLFILALSREILGQRAEARAAYEAFLELRPHHYWALTRLLALAGADRNHVAGSLLARAADVRPTNYEANRTAAMALQHAGDMERARRYVERARAIEAEANLPVDGWLALFPAFEHWVAGRTEDAAQLIDEQLSAHQTSDSVLRLAADFNLALGRLHAAERALARVGTPQGFLPALTSWLQGSGFISPPPSQYGTLPRFDGWVWLLTHSAKPDQAEALLGPHRTTLRGSPGLAAMEGMLLVASGEDHNAARQLEAAWRQMPAGVFLSMAAADDAAVALERTGQLARSCEILAEATNDPRPSYGNAASMLAWLRARVRLLECYNTVGDLDSARNVSRQLRPLFVVADPAFEPAVRFKAAAH
jgi:tetratricopeptide (TPR) repeat protein